MKLLFTFLILMLGLGSMTVRGQEVPEEVLLEGESLQSDSTILIQEGIASFYGKRFHMRKTANGEVYNMGEMTAAHKNLPFGTILKVTNLKNGREVWIRINDRLPQSSKRIIDLSRGVATELQMVRDGIVRVRLEVPDQEAVLALMAHYQDNKPEDIRLRVYEEPVVFSKPDIFGLEMQLEVKAELIASL